MGIARPQPPVNLWNSVWTGNMPPKLAPTTLGGGKNGLKCIRHMKTAIFPKEIQKVFERSVQ